MTSKIIFENLKIYAYHGVLEEEKVLGTYFILNVELSADLNKASQTDDLADTINYAEVNEIIHQEMATPSQLLEHAIARLIRKIKAKFPQITLIKVKLTKTNPPMRGEMDGVSIEIEEKY